MTIMTQPVAEQGAIDAEESLKLNEARLKMGVGLSLEVLQAEKALIQSRKITFHQ